MRLNNVVNGSIVPYDGQRFQITRNLATIAGSSLCISWMYGNQVIVSLNERYRHHDGKVGCILLVDQHIPASMIPNVATKAAWCPRHLSFHYDRALTCTLETESAAQGSTRMDKARIFLAATSAALFKDLESPRNSCR